MACRRDDLSPCTTSDAEEFRTLLDQHCELKDDLPEPREARNVAG
jgi:hypothetical protein